MSEVDPMVDKGVDLLAERIAGKDYSDTECFLALFLSLAKDREALAKRVEEFDEERRHHLDIREQRRSEVTRLREALEDEVSMRDRIGDFIVTLSKQMPSDWESNDPDLKDKFRVIWAGVEAVRYQSRDALRKEASDES